MFLTGNQMSGEIRRVKTLAEDVNLLSSLGDLVTIQIDLLGAERVADQMKESFNDAEAKGLYIDNMVLQRVVEGTHIDYIEIFEDIVEIIGDYEAIDGVTALIRIEYQNQPVEITVELVGNHRSPQLLNITDQSHYFQISRLIQTRWQFARSKMM